MASMWAMVSVTETGHRGLLLISPCDLRQDTDSSGGSDSRARPFQEHVKTTAKACPPAGLLPRPTRGLLDSPLSCHKGRTVAWHLCSTPSARHMPPNTFHTPCTHQPHTNHMISTGQPHPFTHPPHALHTPTTCHHILPKCLPHAIHMPSVGHPHTFFMSSTHKLHAISMPSITCDVPFTHTYMLAIRVLSLSSQMRTRHPLGTPRTAQPRQDPKPLVSAKTRSPSPMAPPAPHLCRCSPPG